MTQSISPLLRVARSKDRTTVLGPGVRAVIWFHGCSLNCHGCIAYEMNHSTDWTGFSPTELCAEISQVQGITGITLSGGDPFDQPKSLLLDFLRLIRANTNLSIMCYTGRTVEQLLSAKDAGLNKEILDLCDLVIDGVYEESLNQGHLWRGSSNQKFHFFTDRYLHLKDQLNESTGRFIEIDISQDNQVAITGIPQPGFINRLRDQLAEQGVSWSFTGESIQQKRIEDQ